MNFTEAEEQRFAYELTQHAGDFGIDEAEAQKAFEQANQIVITYNLLENWRAGNLKVGWSVKDQDLVWSMTDQGTAKVEDMLADAPVDGNRRRGE